MLKELLIKSTVKESRDKLELASKLHLLSHMCSWIHIVKQDVTNEELDAIIDSDQQNQIFAQSVGIYKKHYTCLTMLL